jgi:hypothetical protein
MASLISAFASMSHTLSILSFSFILELFELSFLLITMSILVIDLKHDKYTGHSYIHPVTLCNMCDKADRYQ